MIIIGELINSSRSKIAKAIEEKDAEYIKGIATKQADAGADYIDINCGTNLKTEEEDLSWLAGIVQEVVELPLCIDSPRPSAIEAVLKINKNSTPIINSVTAEKERAEVILPMVKEHKCNIVALTMDESGVPHDTEGRFASAEKLAGFMDEYGIPMDNVFFDAIVQPVSSGPEQGIAFLDAVRKINETFPEAHIVCGLSNISYGLPNRKLVNRVTLAMAMANGLDAAIIDPTDVQMMATICAAEALLARDEYCMKYITASREGKLDV
ncbi:methyltetrahydrofolate cobalamin methyltransferase [Candidatus Poribacteria bacterium]|nr:methyltetrahydrofolate cobalamin methyltransferase [Candidatus Poribacteria bacterium]